MSDAEVRDLEAPEGTVEEAPLPKENEDANAQVHDDDEHGHEDEDDNDEGENEDKEDETGQDKEGENKEGNKNNMKDLEKQEEAKLRAKYPEMKTHPGASSFLQKRLSKGTKYFDSGDYNMAKAKPLIGPGQKVLPGPTGDAIPTPETVPHKKISNLQSKLVNTHLS